MVTTIKKARQLIVHKKVLVNGSIVDSPSYIVPVVFEDKISLKDSKEKKKYDLFSFYSKKEFQSAKFLEMNDGSIILRAVMKDGSIKDTPLTKEEFASVKNSIDKEDIQEEAGEKIAEELPTKTDEGEEKPKKDKVNIVDVVYKIAGVALVIGAVILFPF